MTAMISRFLRDQSGVTAIEYASIASLISLVIVAGVGKVGTSLSSIFNTIAPALR